MIFQEQIHTLPKKTWRFPEKWCSFPIGFQNQLNRIGLYTLQFVYYLLLFLFFTFFKSFIIFNSSHQLMNKKSMDIIFPVKMVQKKATTTTKNLCDQRTCNYWIIFFLSFSLCDAELSFLQFVHIYFCSIAFITAWCIVWIYQCVFLLLIHYNTNLYLFCYELQAYSGYYSTGYEKIIIIIHTHWCSGRCKR